MSARTSGGALTEWGDRVNGEYFSGLIESGAQLLVLLPIPAAAVVCAIALAIGMHRRVPSVIVGAVFSAVAVGVAAMALRDTSVAPAAVDSLVMLLPIALSIGALPTLVRAVPLAARALRRIVASGWAQRVHGVAGTPVVVE